MSKKCCYCVPLRACGIVIGCITTLIHIGILILTVMNVIENNFRSIEEDTLMLATASGIIFSAFLVWGTLKEKKVYLVVWLIFHALYLTFLTIECAINFRDLLNDGRQTIDETLEGFLKSNLIFAFGFCCWIVVYLLFKEFKKNCPTDKKSLVDSSKQKKENMFVNPNYVADKPGEVIESTSVV